MYKLRINYLNHQVEETSVPSDKASFVSACSSPLTAEANFQYTEAQLAQLKVICSLLI